MLNPTNLETIHLPRFVYILFELSNTNKMYQLWTIQWWTNSKPCKPLCAPVIHLNAVLKIAKNLPFHINVRFAQEINIPWTEIAIIMYDNSFSLILRFRLPPWQQFCRENKKLSRHSTKGSNLMSKHKNMVVIVET